MHPTTARPPVRWGKYRGNLTPLRWQLVGGVWRSYWPCGCEQPVQVYTGNHKCEGNS